VAPHGQDEGWVGGWVWSALLSFPQGKNMRSRMAHNVGLSLLLNIYYYYYYYHRYNLIITFTCCPPPLVVDIIFGG